MWNKESIQSLLASNDQAVARACIAIYKLQTADERSTGATRHSNGVGFNGTDARRGTYYAEYAMRTGRLSGRHLEVGRRMMMKYWRQLADIANAKEAQAVESMIDRAEDYARASNGY